MKSTACRTKQTAFVWPNTINHITAKQKPPKRVVLVLWWDTFDKFLTEHTADITLFINKFNHFQESVSINQPELLYLFN